MTADLLAESAQRAMDARYGSAAMVLSAGHAYLTSVLLPDPYGPDRTVFGPPGAVQQPMGGIGIVIPRCACGVSWRGGGECWACEEAAVTNVNQLQGPENNCPICNQLEGAQWRVSGCCHRSSLPVLR